jgi:AraC-like DNA-binding protein
MQHENLFYQNTEDTFLFSLRGVLGHFNMTNYHFHDKYELYYLVSGDRYYFIKDRTYLVKKGSLILIKPYDLHKTTDTGKKDHSRILINFDRSFLTGTPIMEEILEELFYSNQPIITFLPTEQQKVQSFLYNIVHEIKNKEFGFDVSLQALLMELLIFIKRHSDDVPYVSTDHPSAMHEKMSEIVQYINDHYHNDISLETVAKEFFISQYYLSRAFKQATGFTFVEYVNSVRIKEAQTLLRESNEKVIQIAEDVGFGNISHFGRVFKNITGFSPLNYRKTHKS